MTHLLDTDTCIGVLRQRPGMVQRLSQIAPTDCAVSMVTIYELFCGVEKAQDPVKERQKVERFISAIIELPLDRAAGVTGGTNSRGLGTARPTHRPVRFAHRGTSPRQRPDARDEQCSRISARRRTEAGKLTVTGGGIKKILSAAFSSNHPTIKGLIDYD